MTAPSPKQAAELVEWAGSKTAAARAVGVSTVTLHAWLDPAYADAQRSNSRELKRRKRATDPEWRKCERQKDRERYRRTVEDG